MLIGDATTAATAAATGAAAASSALAPEISKLPTKLRAMKLVANILEHFLTSPEKSPDDLVDDIETSLTCKLGRDTENDDVCAMFARTSTITADFMPDIFHQKLLIGACDEIQIWMIPLCITSLHKHVELEFQCLPYLINFIATYGRCTKSPPDVMTSQKGKKHFIEIVFHVLIIFDFRESKRTFRLLYVYIQFVRFLFYGMITVQS